MQDFWSKQCFGLACLLEPETGGDPARRAAEAKRHLAESLGRLRECSQLELRNLSFVTEVQSWGSYKPVDKCEFLPGQIVLLYAELENIQTRSTPKGYHTSWRSSYQVFDSRGTRVAEHEFGPNEEYCKSPRCDFFIGCEFSMPKQIYPGKHTLQLTVVDLNSQKVGQSTIEFAIRAAKP